MYELGQSLLFDNDRLSHTHTHTNKEKLGLFGSFKGQSAIEYLMTYGWMLLVVAVVGGAIFATVGDQSVDSTSGFTGSDVQVDDFGVTSDDDLDLELRSSTGEGATVSAINVTDQSSGEYIYKEFSSDNKIDVGSSLVLSLPNVSQTEGSNSLDVEILYDSGGLSNMSVSGSISGSLSVNETTEVNNDGGGGSTGSTTGTVSVNPDISGATVEAYSSGNLIESAQTDSNGGYSLSTEPSSIDRLVVSSEKDISLNGDPLYAGAEITSVDSSPVNFNFNESAAWTDVEINGTNMTIANQLESSGGQPYPIANVGMLQAMQENSTTNYTIIRDIAASETENWNYNSTTGNYSGFDPVENSFTGNFDGAGNTIDELYINRPNDTEVGIFSETTSSCDINSASGNFTVSNFNVTGESEVGYLIGNTFSGHDIQNETVNFKGVNNLEGESLVGNSFSSLAGLANTCLHSVDPIR